MSTKENKMIQLYKKIYRESFSETKDKKFLFLFFLGLFFALFFLTFFLIGKNPYSLLIPFSLYDSHLFLYDKRSKVIIFLSDGKGSFFPVQRKLIKTGSLREDIKKLVIEISEPPYYEMEYSNFDNLQLTYKKLPNIHFALIQVWTLGDNIILDFRESTLKDEMENQRVRIDTGTYQIEEQTETGNLAQEKLQEDKTKLALEKMKKDLLTYSFIALEKTLFENFPQIKRIEYRLNGQKKDFEDLEYKLSEIHERQ